MGLLTIQWICIAALVVCAFHRGGRPEQIGSLIIATASVSDRLWHLLVQEPVTATVDHWHFGLDLSMFIAAYALALSVNRIWPMPFASTCLLAVLSHLARMIQLEMHPLVYAIIAQVPFWLSITTVLIGVITYGRSRRAANVEKPGA